MPHVPGEKVKVHNPSIMQTLERDLESVKHPPGRPHRIHLPLIDFEVNFLLYISRCLIFSLRMPFGMMIS